ncbi:MAG: GNAT family protein [Bacteroidota bacterium]
MQNWIEPTLELDGQFVKLIPLEAKHESELLIAASDGKLWELWFTSVPSTKTIKDYIETAISNRDKGKQIPFSVVDKSSGKIIGCTRFYNIYKQNRRVEIGYTWYAQSFQKTAINSECKLLLLQYAFEELNCIAVQFMTDWFNLPSRKAISRLGAKQDGILRQHRINNDGSFRDTVVFSITNPEWIGVKKSLEQRLYP